jgi:exosortase E/protease (VPEID-CTERM system)
MTASVLAAPRPALVARGALRAATILVLLLLELVTFDRNYSFVRAVGGAQWEFWSAFNTALKHGAYVGVFSALIFGLLSLADERGLANRFTHRTGPHRWGLWLALQSILFAALLTALLAFQNPVQSAPWLSFLLWLAGGGAMAICAGLAIAPLSFWRALSDRSPLIYAAAFGVGVLAYLALGASQNSWDGLSAATLHAAYWLLTLYEPAVSLDAPGRLLGVGDFTVAIYAPCSGYEGVGLVLVGLGAYICAFRRDLRFPAVLALLPIGAVAIWLLNAVRIAALVSLGAHISPDFALNGFHAQAGWIVFLIVTVSLMMIAHRTPMFRAGAAQRISADPALGLAAALLTPFAALMAARIAAALFGPEAYWAGVVAMIAPALALAAWRKTIAPLISGKIVESAAIGLVVGLLWVLTEPAGGEGALGGWLASLPDADAAIWLAMRLTGFVLIVPLAEELAFRGYLHRVLAKRRFEEAAPAAFGWAAFLITSLLFGAMHGRWLAGALAGGAFALALYRSKSLAGPIAAHIAANGFIAVWALTAQSWDLL